MSDTRFTIAGIGLIFAGFVILGIFGGHYEAATFESEEFGTCYEYSDDAPPAEIDCSAKIAEQAAFFGIVIGLIGGGVASLVKGMRGDWDSRVRPEDVVGPGSGRNDPGGK